VGARGGLLGRVLISENEMGVRSKMRRVLISAAVVFVAEVYIFGACE
jgi:hypothetical protein